MQIDITPVIEWGPFVIWGGIKIASSFFISREEFKYPRWDKAGTQRSPRGLHHRIQAWIRNAVFNPEWAFVKAAAFCPTFVITGMKYADKFVPWKIQRCPPACSMCKDTGKYSEGAGFLRKGKTVWQNCGCQQAEPSQPNVWYTRDRTGKRTTHGEPTVCQICLNSGSIGPKKACPRCALKAKAHSGGGGLPTNCGHHSIISTKEPSDHCDRCKTKFTKEEKQIKGSRLCQPCAVYTYNVTSKGGPSSREGWVAVQEGGKKV